MRMEVVVVVVVVVVFEEVCTLPIYKDNMNVLSLTKIKGKMF